MSQPSPDRALGSLAAAHGLAPEQEAQLARLVERLHTDEAAPTAIRDPQHIVDAHVADSLSALEIEPVRRATEVVDIGSGAGVPGLVLAVALPSARVRLVDGQSRKCAYVARLIDSLGLTNAEAVWARAEEWTGGRGRHDLALARAVGPQPVILEYAAPLLRTHGILVDWRGARDPDDEAAALRAAGELGMGHPTVRAVTPYPGARAHHLHVFEKVAATPDRFPRRAGMARKRPLG